MKTLQQTWEYEIGEGGHVKLVVRQDEKFQKKLELWRKGELLVEVGPADLEHLKNVLVQLIPERKYSSER